MPFPAGVTFDPVTGAVTNYPDSVIREKVVGYTAIDINGNTTSHSIRVDRDTSDADIIYALGQVFNKSASAPRELRITQTFTFSDPAILSPLDDTQGALSRVLSLKFVGVDDGRAESRTVEVPAPRSFLLNTSGAFDPTGAEAQELLDALVDILDEWNANVAYNSATVGQRKYRLNGRSVARTPFIPAGIEEAGVDVDGGA